MLTLDRNRKVPTHQVLTVHITTHRLILTPSASATSTARAGADSTSLTAELKYIRQTEFYTGFMRSSPKITLTLGMPSTNGAPGVGSSISSASIADTELVGADTSLDWVCAVCGYSNGGEVIKCALCGVSGQKKDVGGMSRGTGSVPASIPGTPDRAGTPRRSIDVDADDTGPQASEAVADAGPASKAAPTEIACPVCTFLNHASMRSCEICSAKLPRPNAQANGANRPSGRGSSLPDSGATSLIRLSFRKDGSKVAYAKLKSVLSQKAWERNVSSTICIRHALGPDDTSQRVHPGRELCPLRPMLRPMARPPRHPAQASTPSSLPSKSPPTRASPISRLRSPTSRS